MKLTARDKDGKYVEIEDAVRGETYYDRYGNKLMPKKGNIRVHHYALNNAEYSPILALHDDAIDYHCYKNEFEIWDITLKPHVTLPNDKKKEYGGFVPDAVMFDESGNVMGWIEVEVTHENTSKKNKYIKDNDIICIVYKYEKGDNYKEPRAVEYILPDLFRECFGSTKDQEQMEREIERIEADIRSYEERTQYYRGQIEYYVRRIKAIKLTQTT